MLLVPTLVLVGYYGAGLLGDVPWLGTALVVGGVGFLVIGTGYGIWQYRREMRRPVASQTVPIMMDGSLEGILKLGYQSPVRARRRDMVMIMARVTMASWWVGSVS